MVRVAQCWDDGVVNDIRVTEILREYGAKATFNLNPGLHPESRTAPRWVEKGYKGWSFKGFVDGKLGKAELVEIYSGFQVASHCMRHETAGTLPDEDFVKAAVDARKYLEDLFQQECRGFAWPCGRYTQTTADALLEAGFAYGRTTEYNDNVLDYEHPLILRSSCHFHDRQFYEKFEKAKAENGVFYFWGHSYEMLDSEGLWKQFEQKIQFLSDDPEVVWCDVVDLVQN